MTKKVLSLLLALCLIIGAVPVFASANSDAGLRDMGQLTDDVEWSLMTDGTLTISSEFMDNGEFKEVNMPNFTSSMPWEKYKSDIRYVYIGDNILNIGGNTFNGCKNIVSIYFPTSVSVVGGDAFYGCTGLKYIHYAGSESDFSDLAQQLVLNGGCSDTIRAATMHFNCDRSDVVPKDPPKPGVEFADVPAGKYFTEPVTWAVSQGITNGKGRDDKGNQVFHPELDCTRAEIVTFLWRFMGKMDPYEMATFPDMPSNGDFKKAISYCVENGITKGKGRNDKGQLLFQPNGKCTRAEAVTFIWRAMGKIEPSKLASFPDMPSNGDFQKAISWAVENGITNGKGRNEKGELLFQPDGTCSRGEIVTFLYRIWN